MVHITWQERRHRRRDGLERNERWPSQPLLVSLVAMQTAGKTNQSADYDPSRKDDKRSSPARGRAQAREHRHSDVASRGIVMLTTRLTELN